MKHMNGKMKAMVLHDWVTTWGDNLKLEDVAIPTPGPHDALVKVRACGVGLTVSNFLLGHSTKDPQLLPQIPGHEVAGQVVQVGDAVENIKVKDRVITYFYLSCGYCRYCLAGKQDLCNHSQGRFAIHIPGGYAEYIRVPARNLFTIPDDIPYKEATVICDAVATPVHVMNDRAQVQPGDTVMVVGAGGGVGIHAVQMAKLFGARVIGVDISDTKLDAVKRLGADAVINNQKQPMTHEVMRLTNNEGVDAAIDFASTTQTLRECFKSLAIQGRLIKMASHPGVTLTIPARQLGERVITGSRYATKSEFLQAIQFVHEQKITPIISKTSSLEDVEHLHILLDRKELLGRGAIIFPE
jgi:propanol-preferring alcohol dehydrogenase